MSTTTKRSLRQNGYTLIELLLYVAIVGSLLSAITMYLGTTTESRVKNQSIAEVDQQGTLLMEYITQTIRNASSIVTPAQGESGAALTLAVPTGANSPTIFSLGGTTIGYDVDGTATGTSNSNVVYATKFTASASGTISTLYARVGATVAASPNNKGQMALYSGASNPTTLLASSPAVALTASAWNAFNITPVSVTSGQTYWLAYNTNGLAAGDNDLRYHAGATSQTRFVTQTYGSWPASFTGTTQNNEYCMYAQVNVGASASPVQIREGANAVVALTSDKLQITNLTFKNLSRNSTPGIVQVSFTLKRYSTSVKNEYDFQKTFAGSAAVRP